MLFQKVNSSRGSNTALWTMISMIPHRPVTNVAVHEYSDFHLFGPMKNELRGQYFPNSDAVVRAVKQWATSACEDFYERPMQALVHRWRKCIANGGNYVEK